MIAIAAHRSASSSVFSQTHSSPAAFTLIRFNIRSALNANFSQASTVPMQQSA